MALALGSREGDDLRGQHDGLIWRPACQVSALSRPAVVGRGSVPAGQAPGAVAMVDQSDMRGLATPVRCFRRRPVASLGTGVARWELPIEPPRVPADPSARHLPPGRAAVLSALLGQGCRPEEAGQLGGGGHGDRVGGFASRTHAAGEAIEAPLRTPGDRRHCRRLAAGELDRDPRLLAGVLGRLDQDAARIGRAGLGDRAALRALPRLFKRGHKAQPGRQLAGPAKARPVVHVEVQDQGSQRVQAAEASQAGDRRPEEGICGQTRELLVEGRLARREHLDGPEAVVEGERGALGREALRGEPAPMGERPGAASRIPDAAVAQEQLAGALAGAQKVGSYLPAGAREVAGRLEGRRGLIPRPRE